MNHHLSDAISREYIKSLLEARRASYDQASKKDKLAIAIEVSLLETILNAHQPVFDHSALQKRSWMSNHY